MQFKIYYLLGEGKVVQEVLEGVFGELQVRGTVREELLEGHRHEAAVRELAGIAQQFGEALRGPAPYKGTKRQNSISTLF